MEELTLEDLKVVQDFQHVPAEQLQWLTTQGEIIHLETGEILFNIGDPVVKTYIILTGKFRVCITQSGKLKEIHILDPGQATGFLPYSRAKNTPAFCEAI